MERAADLRMPAGQSRVRRWRSWLLLHRVHADPWFSIPHRADDYVRHFAETVRESLDPILKVYIEYSNEVWNDVYPQTIYAVQNASCSA